jgi:hypothetical protein
LPAELRDQVFGLAGRLKDGALRQRRGGNLALSLERVELRVDQAGTVTAEVKEAQA